jgi:Cellulase (glycosyl hydrolase family 5)/Glycosyl hydrolases family 16
MRKAILASTILAALPIAAQGQAVDLNLSSITPNGTSTSWMLGFPWGGGNQYTLSSNGEGEEYSLAGVSTNSSGDLVLTASPNPNTSGAWPADLPYQSGAVSSASINNGMPQPGGFQATQGTWSVTASLPVGTGTSAGIWPAIWLEPVSGNGACEVDIMEAPFNNDNKYQASLHGGSGLGQVVNTTSPLTSMNTYSVTLNGSIITYYFNGQQVAQAAEPADCDQPLYLLMNVAVGGQSWSWPGTTNSSTQFPASMVISKVSYTPGSNGSYAGGLAGAATAATTAAAVTPPATSAVVGANGADGTAGIADPPAASSDPPAATDPPAETSAATTAMQITPGGSSVTDCSGNTWSINANNKILENGVPVPGGGDTSALTMNAGCTVYGLSNGNNGSKTGWFTLSSVIPGNQTWNYMGATATPPSAGTSSTDAAAPSTAAAATPAVSIAPLAVQSCPAGSTASTGGFHVAAGQIIGPDGKAWIARGVDLHVDNLGAAAQQLPTQFPGVNLVRVAAGDYEPLGDPAASAAAVASLTAHGTVVEFTDYSNSLGTGSGGAQGVVFTGSLLANELAWYSAMASYYKNNPYVWLGTNNEPATTGGSLSDWQLATYQAIRNAGNNNIIFLEPSGSRPPGYGGSPLQAAMNPADYTGMKNVVWDPHVYAYQDGGSSDQSTADALVAAMVAAAQTIQSADGVVPAVIGEYGPEGDGGMTTVMAVINAGASGTTGSAAWVWDQDGVVGGPTNDPADAQDGLVSGGQMTTYGQMVALYVNTNVVPLTNCQQTAAAQQAVNAASASLQPPATTTPPQ